jgi:hypothetical protein
VPLTLSETPTGDSVGRASASGFAAGSIVIRSNSDHRSSIEFDKSVVTRYSFRHSTVIEPEVQAQLATLPKPNAVSTFLILS